MLKVQFAVYTICVYRSAFMNMIRTLHCLISMVYIVHGQLCSYSKILFCNVTRYGTASLWTRPSVKPYKNELMSTIRNASVVNQEL